MDGFKFSGRDRMLQGRVPSQVCEIHTGMPFQQRSKDCHVPLHGRRHEGCDACLVCRFNRCAAVEHPQDRLPILFQRRDNKSDLPRSGRHICLEIRGEAILDEGSSACRRSRECDKCVGQRCSHLQVSECRRGGNCCVRIRRQARRSNQNQRRGRATDKNSKC